MYHGLVFLLAVGLQPVHGHLDLILQQSSCTFCAAVLPRAFRVRDVMKCAMRAQSLTEGTHELSSHV